MGIVVDSSNAWKERAACAGINDNTFFPNSNDGESARDALALCAACPVLVQCGEYALRNDISEGVWGGMTARMRQAERIIRGYPADIAVYATVTHGTEAGAKWERRHGLKRCELCADAERRATNERSAKRRSAKAGAPAMVL